MSRIEMWKQRIAVGLIFSFILGMMGIFSGRATMQAKEKEDYEAILKLSDKVLPNFSFSDATEREIKVLTILAAAKAKATADYEILSPLHPRFDEYDLSEYNKVSKKLFGKVFSHGFPDEKAAGGRGNYYNKKTKTIFKESGLNVGDLLVKRNRRVVEKLSKNRFVVKNFDSGYNPFQFDKRPTMQMNVYIAKTKKGYFISDIKLTEISKDTLKIDKKAAKKQIANIKKWFQKLPKNVVRKDFKHDGRTYIVLRKNGTIVFLYEKDGTVEKRFYYLDGIPVRSMKSEDEKSLYSYDLWYEGEEIMVNGLPYDSDDEDMRRSFLDADNAYEEIDLRAKR